MPIERKIGLAAWYNELYAPRFALAPHHYPIIMGLEDPSIENLFFLAPPGCLSGDTKLRLRLGAHDVHYEISFADYYAKFHGLYVL